jgi:hypothetical protein
VRKLWVRKCSSWEEEAQADRVYWAQYSGDEKVAQIELLKDTWDSMRGVKRPHNDQAEFLETLNKHGVKALVIGAMAFAFHARPRFTGDVDVFIEASPDNAARVIAAIDEFGFGGIGIAPGDFEQAGQIVQLGIEPNRIDITTRIHGITFEEAWPNRVAGKFEDVPVFYIGRDDLIRNKEASARPIDLADVSILKSMR